MIRDIIQQLGTLDYNLHVENLFLNIYISIHVIPVHFQRPRYRLHYYKVLWLSKILIIQSNIFVLNHHSKEANNC